MNSTSAPRSHTVTRPLGFDAAGASAVSVTITRARTVTCETGTSGHGVILLHGWSDYIFHTHVMEHFRSRGIDVAALHLRRSGPARRPGEVATLVTDLADHDEEISIAISELGCERIVIIAHSMGGLIAAQWAARHAGIADGLILNSPWLEFHGGALMRRAAATVLRSLARRWPGARALPPGSAHHAHALHREFGGEWDWDLKLKPAHGHPFPLGTLSAVLAAQTDLAARAASDTGGPVHEPVLVLTSTRTRFALRWRPELAYADTVIRVKQTHRAAARLGPRVQIEPIPGAPHDVLLGRPPVRADALRRIDGFLREIGFLEP